MNLIWCYELALSGTQPSTVEDMITDASTDAITDVVTARETSLVMAQTSTSSGESSKANWIYSDF